MLNLELQLVAVDAGRQRCQQLERSSQMSGRLDEGRPSARPPACFYPKIDRWLNAASFAEMLGNELRSSFAGFGKGAAQRLGDRAMQLAALLAKQACVRFVLHQGMFEGKMFIPRMTGPEHKAGGD